MLGRHTHSLSVVKSSTRAAAVESRYAAQISPEEEGGRVAAADRGACGMLRELHACVRVGYGF